MRHLSLSAICVLLLAFGAGAQPIFPLRQKSDTPCTACPGTSANLLTAGWGSPDGATSWPIAGFVGRWCDSSFTRDHQGSLRTARAYNVKFSPDGARVYIQLGNAIAAYTTSTFFSRQRSGESMVSALTAPMTYPNARYGPVEYYLAWDRFFHADYTNSGWITPLTDGQDRLIDFDVDDLGRVYLAYSKFGWGVVQDDGGSGGNTLMKSLFQDFAITNTGGLPTKICAVRATSGYYALVYAAGASDTKVFRIGSSPVAVSSLGIAPYAYAKSADRVAIISADQKQLLIYDPDDLVSGKGPLVAAAAASNGSWGAVTSDGTDFYAVSSAAVGNSATISSFVAAAASRASSYTRSDTATNEAFVGLNGKGCAGFVSFDGFIGSTRAARLYKVSHGQLTEVPLRDSLTKYYGGAIPAGYTAPQYGTILTTQPWETAGHLYLVVAANGLGDTYEINVPSDISFSAAPARIAKGQSTTLTWSVGSDASVSIDNGIGQRAAKGAATVTPAQTTTYTLTTSSGSTATTTVEVVTDPLLVFTAFPAGIAQEANGTPGSDRAVLMNIGGSTAAVTLEIAPAGATNPFLIGTTQFALGAGESRTITINASSVAAGTYSAQLKATAAGSSVLADLRLLATSRPSGTVGIRPEAGRVDVGGAGQASASGSARFTNAGTGTVEAIAVSDVPWIRPQASPVTIAPGSSVDVGFTIDPAQRPPVTAQVAGDTGTLSLVYLTSATGKGAAALDTGGTGNSPVSVVYTPRPAPSAGSIPPLASGQIASFVSGVRRSGSLVTDFFAFNRQPASALASLVLYFSSATLSTAQVASIGSVTPVSTVAIGDVVSAMNGNPSMIGTIQARAAEFSAVQVGASLINARRDGQPGTSLVPFRSDRSLPAGGKAYLVGLVQDDHTTTKVSLQEVSGNATTVETVFMAPDGTIFASSNDNLPAFGVVELSAPTPAAAITALVTNTGSGRVVPQAMLTDTTTGDVTQVVDWNLVEGSTGSPALVIPFLRRDSHSGTVPEIVLMNSGSDATITVDVRGTARTRRRAIAHGQSVSPELSGVLVRSGTTTTLDVLTTDVPAAAAVITSSASTPTITARLQSVSASGGRFTTTIPVVPAASAMRLAERRYFPGIEDASAATTAKRAVGSYHASFGLVEVGGGSVKVSATLFYTSESPTSRVSLRAPATKEFVLAAGEARHFSNLAAELIGDRSSLADLHSMLLQLTVVSGNGAVIPYVVSTENATGDAIVRME